MPMVMPIILQIYFFNHGINFYCIFFSSNEINAMKFNICVLDLKNLYNTITNLLKDFPFSSDSVPFTCI